MAFYEVSIKMVTGSNVNIGFNVNSDFSAVIEFLKVESA
jgi:hypothetical protein